MKSEFTGSLVQYRWHVFFLSLCMLMMTKISFATSASDVQGISEKAVKVGLASQATHDSWVEEEHRLLEQIEDLENSLEHTQWQRKKLVAYKSDLKGKIAGLQKKAEAMEAVNMKLLPVLEEILTKLQRMVAGDIPVHLTERRKALHQAFMVLNDYDSGLLGKTRAVLDAVAREVDFGHQVNVLEDEIEVDGQRRRVKILQVGRVGVYAITLDSEKAWQWDMSDFIWQPIENDSTAIRDAIEMAEGIRLVGLSNLPVAQPKTEKMQGTTAQ